VFDKSKRISEMPTDNVRHSIRCSLIVGSRLSARFYWSAIFGNSGRREHYPSFLSIFLHQTFPNITLG